MSRLATFERSNYLPHIDILRAVAVLTVVAFHWNLSWFKGGFVGVDVFFVISGYLISGLIVKQCNEGQLSLAKFYMRRARRLLPNLYLMIIVVLIFGWLFILPSGMEALGKSAIFNIIFSSNILFWQQSGYFDAASIDKPLLHTWSLSVEEQFYFIMPSLIVLIVTAVKSRRSPLILALSGLAFISFALCCVGTHDGSTAAFYLPTSRAWEFLLGALLTTTGGSVGGRLPKLGAAVGIMAIVLAANRFRDGVTPFPGPAALLPCLGAVAFIWGGAGTNSLHGPLGFMRDYILAPIGRASYALYLWHWPVYVIYSAFLGRPLSANVVDLTFLSGLTTLATFLSYSLVECPIRLGNLIKSNASFCGGLAFSAASILAYVITAQTFPSIQSRYGGVAARISAYDNYPIHDLYRGDTCFLGDKQHFDDYNLKECFHQAPNKTNVLLWGDSLSADLLPGMRSAFESDKVNFLQADASACAPIFNADVSGRPLCREFNNGVRHLIAGVPTLTIIMSADWWYAEKQLGSDNMLNLLQNTVEIIQKQGNKVILLGPSFHWNEHLPKLLARKMNQPISSIDMRSNINVNNFRIDDMMERRFAGRVPYISIIKSTCVGDVCPFLVGDILVTWDHMHLTKEGSILVVSKIKSQLSAIIGDGDADHSISHTTLAR